MTIGLHNLSRSGGHRSRRVGRGHGSGRGTYAGRGMKGQRARTGGRKGIIRRSFSRTIAHLPKQRGFRGPSLPYRIVNLDVLERHCQANENVTPQRLAGLGFSLLGRRGVKILGEGKLTKALTVSAHAFSQSAERAITKAGGTVIRLRT